jgi:hypothetical protein
MKAVGLQQSCCALLRDTAVFGRNTLARTSGDSRSPGALAAERRIILADSSGGRQPACGTEADAQGY